VSQNKLGLFGLLCLVLAGSFFTFYLFLPNTFLEKVLYLTFTLYFSAMSVYTLYRMNSNYNLELKDD
jgi:hypothetical protein